VAECSDCHLALIPEESADPTEESDSTEESDAQDPDAEDPYEAREKRRRSNEQAHVVAFETDDPVLLALAEQSLDKAHVPFLRHAVRPDGADRWAWRADADVPAKLVVNADDADDAAAALADLTADAEESPAVDAPEETRSNTEAMDNVQLHNADNNEPLGDITSDELQFLFDRLERESDSDDDFFINAATIEMLEDAKAPAHLVDVLKKAVGTGEGVEVRWASAGTEI
jgi:hypothetical protein